MSYPCPTCGDPSDDPDFDCDMCDSWDLTGIHFKNPEWPPIRVEFKTSNKEREEPVPEDVGKIQGGRFTNKKPKTPSATKPVQDALFDD